MRTAFELIVALFFIASAMGVASRDKKSGGVAITFVAFLIVICILWLAGAFDCIVWTPFDPGSSKVTATANH